MPPKLFHRRSAEGPSYWGPGDLYTFLVTGEESAGACFSMLATVPPQGGPPPHVHLKEDETFYVLEGTPTFRLGDERIVAGPGLRERAEGPRPLFHQSLREPDNLAEVCARYADAAPRYGMTFFLDA